jgi:hypothetical protein
MKHRHFCGLGVSRCLKYVNFSNYYLCRRVCVVSVIFSMFHSSWLFLEPCDCYALLFVLFSWVIFRGIGFENYGLMVV